MDPPIFADPGSYKVEKPEDKIYIVKDKGISAFPDGDNLLSWVGTVVGPQVKRVLINIGVIFLRIIS